MVGTDKEAAPARDVLRGLDPEPSPQVGVDDGPHQPAQGGVGQRAGPPTCRSTSATTPSRSRRSVSMKRAASAAPRGATVPLLSTRSPPVTSVALLASATCSP